MTTDNLYLSLKQKKTEGKIVKNHKVFFNPERRKVGRVLLLFWTNFLCFQKSLVAKLYFFSFVCSQSQANPAKEIKMSGVKRETGVL